MDSANSDTRKDSANLARSNVSIINRGAAATLPIKLRRVASSLFIPSPKEFYSYRAVDRTLFVGVFRERHGQEGIADSQISNTLLQVAQRIGHYDRKVDRWPRENEDKDNLA
jgi:hypothetical protein